MRACRDADDGFAVTDIVGDDRTGAGRGSIANPNGSDQNRVTADERSVADDRLMFVRAIVICGDDARSDVDVVADGDVTEVGEVADPDASAE
jgi:hypothetical protein